jgi:prepilin-type N-terminal cleavage/methylation domain-containing protein
MKRGMTLVEVLVSIVILAFVLGAIFTILNLQSARSVQVQKTSVLQTDAQVALSLMKWDLATAGLAYPKQDDAVQAQNGGAGGTDGITIRAAMLGFESGRCMWSWLMEDAANTNVVMVRAWEDSTYNFHVGDTVAIISRDRRVMDPPGYITVTQTVLDTFFDPYGTPFPAQRLTLSSHVNAIRGLVIMGVIPAIYNPGMALTVSNGKLMRGNEVMLDNVEDLQFAYGIDNDNDNIIETWTDDVPQFAAQGRKWAIRYTMVITSRPMAGYTYPDDDVTVEDHNYELTPHQKRQKRAILSGIISPQNLQP